MSAIILYPLVVAILGLLVYLLAANPKAQEIGRIMFFCGLFWLVAMFSGRTLHLP